MQSTLAVHFLPALTSPEELAAGDVVMIDVLRASTTITHAIASGALSVIPCGEIEEARQTAAQLPDGTFVLGGERGGLPIEGFHLGNSPTEYSPAAVAGKTVVFTTTNGTAALVRCRSAAQVLIGAFANLSAIAKRIDGRRPVHLLCAGTRGRVTREDVLFAGALTEQLLEGPIDHTSINDQAKLALDSWQSAIPPGRHRSREMSKQLGTALRQCQGGRNLIGIGLERDIETAAEVDRFDLVPVLDIQSWRITATC